MIKYFKRNHKTSVQFITYTFVGGLAFVIDFAALWFFTDVVGIYYLYSAVISFILGLTTNYLLSINWVFSVRRVKNAKLEFGVFTFIGVLGLSLNEIVLWFFTEEQGLHYLNSKIIATVAVFLWNFFARKFTLF